MVLQSFGSRLSSVARRRSLHRTKANSVVFLGVVRQYRALVLDSAREQTYSKSTSYSSSLMCILTCVIS